MAAATTWFLIVWVLVLGPSGVTHSTAEWEANDKADCQQRQVEVERGLEGARRRQDILTLEVWCIEREAK